MQATREIIRDIAPADGMWQTAPDHYFWWGERAVDAIELCLLAAHADDPTRILDLPCGHGRVLRMLHARWPEATLTAGDIDSDGVRFCAQTFGALPIMAPPDPADLDVGGPYELIWVGSLFTHMDHPRWVEFLAAFTSGLAPGGVLVFTTHGRPWVDRATSATMDPFPYPVPRLADLAARFEHDGFGYYDHDGQRFGISACSIAWVSELLDAADGLSHLLSHAGGWGGLQDVHAAIRR